MRFRTAAVAVLVLAALGAVVAYSFMPGIIGGGSTAEVGGQVIGEEFRERWVSDVSTSLESNHHAPAGAFVDGESYVAIPINSRQGTVCALSVVDGDGAERWRTSIPEEECSVHSYSDPVIADGDGDDSFELVATTDDGLVAVVDPNTGEVTASYERDVPVRTFPTLTDYDGDGIEEVLVVYGDGRVVALSAG
ncbi:hypothetical protein BRC90_05250 [Halobacteriales archaeon QS_4_69_34]|nr:MAG: hypothetical protein BRC90_05250 [Halobacteriales archaeon QS_4_69_34]